MPLGKMFRILHKPGAGVCSVLIEHKQREQAILLESQAAALLCAAEVECVRKQYSRHSEAYGCLGVLQLCVSENTCLQYLALVAGCSSVGKIVGAEVYRITQTVFVPLQAPCSDDERVAEVRKVFSAGTFYFSWSGGSGGCGALDLSLCEQRRRHTSHMDNRFFWNKQLHTHLRRFSIPCDEWLLRVICGSVEIRTVYAGASKGQLCLVSRLSAERAGTRFNVRGCCDAGHVANFVESEQCVYMEGQVASHVQVRGSVPLFWDQPGLQVGSHKVRVTRGDECSTPAFDRHFRRLKRRYGRVTIVNLLSASLVGSRGDEAMLSTLFQAHQRELPQHEDIEHLLFDYHAVVRGGAGSSSSQTGLQVLKGKLEPHLDEHSFYFARSESTGDSGEVSSTAEVYREQCGVIRTNCLDCLDRTNCVQTLIGERMLHHQLQYLNLLGRQSVVSRLQQMMREMWVNNGNEISKLYAGTGALQGGSKLMDGARSVSRTIQNNLMDVSKQEAIDTILMGSSLNSDLSDRARILLSPSMLYTEPSLLKAMCTAQDSYSRMHPLHVAVATYNVNGGRHFRSVAYKDHNLSDWLLDAPRLSRAEPLIGGVGGGDSETSTLPPYADIYSIAFQEIVDLNASNIMAASSQNARLWGDELGRVLCRDVEYVPLTSVQLVGVALFVFVRPHLAPAIRDVATETVKTGLGGATGNKGAVAVRLVLYNTSLCFIGAHLAAGQKEVNDRNADYMEISRRLSFPLGRSLFSHDYVLWCGDFNYRLDLPREQVLQLVAAGDWQQLMLHDQLRVQQAAGQCFVNFVEGDVAFAPTYKFDLFSDDYDTSDKCRCPAYTDRVLVWRRRLAHQNNDPAWSAARVLHYGSAGLKQSDHRPVVCHVQLEVRRVDSAQRRAILKQLVQTAGPPNATVIISVLSAGSKDASSAPQQDMYSLSEQEDFMPLLLAELGKYGEVVLVRFSAGGHVLATFRCGDQALAAVSPADAGAGSYLVVSGHRLSVRLLTSEWRDQVQCDMSFGRDNTNPLLAPTAHSSVAEKREDGDDDDDLSVSAVVADEKADISQPYCEGVTDRRQSTQAVSAMFSAVRLWQQQSIDESADCVGDDSVGAVLKPTRPPPPTPQRPPPAATLAQKAVVSSGSSHSPVSTPSSSSPSSVGSETNRCAVPPPVPARGPPAIPARSAAPPPIPSRNSGRVAAPSRSAAPPPIPQRAGFDQTQ